MERLIIDELVIKAEPENYCEEWEMLVVKEGNISVTANHRIYDLQGGTAAFFGPDSFHSLVKKNDSAVFKIFNFKTKNKNIGELKDCAIIIPDTCLQLIDTLNIFSDNIDTDNEILYTTLELFILYSLNTKDILQSSNEKNAITFAKAADVLIKNSNSQISVEELAGKLKISLSNLKRLFAYYTKIGVHEYFTLLKITNAKGLLKSGESVTKTAEICGFSNQAYFSAAFKRITGCSPKEYSPAKEKSPNPVQKKQPKRQEKSLPSYLL